MLELLLAISIALDPAGSFRVAGWAGAADFPPQQYSEVLTVQVDAADVPPLVGSYSITQAICRRSGHGKVLWPVRWRTSGKYIW